MPSTAAKANGREIMRRLALAIVFTLGTVGFGFGQAQTPATDDHSAHHPTQEATPSPQTLPAQPGQSSGSTMGGQPRAMMQGMMQMMQGMQGMMRTMHQQAQSGQRQTGRAPMMQECPMMSGGAGTSSDAATMQAMMQMMQGMMQMMQSQMQPGQRGPQ
jgi:hypothetical protein